MRSKPNPFDKVVMLSFTRHDAVVIGDALEALLVLDVAVGRDKRVLQDTIASISLQLQPLPAEAKKAPYPV